MKNKLSKLFATNTVFFIIKQAIQIDTKTLKLFKLKKG